MPMPGRSVLMLHIPPAGARPPARPACPISSGVCRPPPSPARPLPLYRGRAWRWVGEKDGVGGWGAGAAVLEARGRGKGGRSRPRPTRKFSTPAARGAARAARCKRTPSEQRERIHSERTTPCAAVQCGSSLCGSSRAAGARRAQRPLQGAGGPGTGAGEASLPLPARLVVRRLRLRVAGACPAGRKAGAHSADGRARAAARLSPRPSSVLWRLRAFQPPSRPASVSQCTMASGAGPGAAGARRRIGLALWATAMGRAANHADPGPGARRSRRRRAGKPGIIIESGL